MSKKSKLIVSAAVLIAFAAGFFIGQHSSNVSYKNSQFNGPAGPNLGSSIGGKSSAPPKITGPAGPNLSGPLPQTAPVATTTKK